MAEPFIFPKTMEAIMERLVADLKSAVEKADTWRTIADALVYTEHDDFAHIHMRADQRCERCAAHDKYHEQVSIEDNP
jgi:hypothetical protein